MTDSDTTLNLTPIVAEIPISGDTYRLNTGLIEQLPGARDVTEQVLGDAVDSVLGPIYPLLPQNILPLASSPDIIQRAIGLSQFDTLLVSQRKAVIHGSVIMSKGRNAVLAVESVPPNYPIIVQKRYNEAHREGEQHFTYDHAAEIIADYLRIVEYWNSVRDYPSGFLPFQSLQVFDLNGRPIICGKQLYIPFPTLKDFINGDINHKHILTGSPEAVLRAFVLQQVRPIMRHLDPYRDKDAYHVLSAYGDFEVDNYPVIWQKKGSQLEIRVVNIDTWPPIWQTIYDRFKQYFDPSFSFVFKTGGSRREHAIRLRNGHCTKWGLLAGLVRSIMENCQPESAGNAFDILHTIPEFMVYWTRYFGRYSIAEIAALNLKDEQIYNEIRASQRLPALPTDDSSDI